MNITVATITGITAVQRPMINENGMRLKNGKVTYDQLATALAIFSITSCVWLSQPGSHYSYSPPAPSTACTFNDILDSVQNEKVFGFIQCDIYVPPEKLIAFLNFPVFKNCEIKLADIGDYMRKRCSYVGRTLG